MILFGELDTLLITISLPSSEIHTGILGEIDWTRFNQTLFESNGGDLNEYIKLLLTSIKVPLISSNDLE